VNCQRPRFSLYALLDSPESQNPPVTGYTITLSFAWLLVIAVALGLYPILKFANLMSRRSQHRRGLCVKCAYNLTGNTTGVCPECGTPVNTKTAKEPGSPQPGEGL
ncbi:MAG: hypothetical protein Q7R41_09505, partial [Phycisphaerales bacterium]|nr:hypothetical protein [Phycisphaerales bacterium]